MCFSQKMCSNISWSSLKLLCILFISLWTLGCHNVINKSVFQRYKFLPAKIAKTESVLCCKSKLFMRTDHKAQAWWWVWLEKNLALVKESLSCIFWPLTPLNRNKCSSFQGNAGFKALFCALFMHCQYELKVLWAAVFCAVIGSCYTD